MYKYDKPYYRSAGSLDAQPGAERYEFSSPISGVLGSFISSDSYINPTVQSVSGPAAQVASVMFAQSPNHKAFVGSDYDQAALTKFGITYLVNNGSTIAYGTSGTPGSGNGADGGNVVSPYATHIMGNTGLAMQAIYPPVPPKSSINYHYDVTTNRQKTRRCKLYSIFRQQVVPASNACCSNYKARLV